MFLVEKRPSDTSSVKSILRYRQNAWVDCELVPTIKEEIPHDSAYWEQIDQKEDLGLWISNDLLFGLSLSSEQQIVLYWGFCLEEDNEYIKDKTNHPKFGDPIYGVETHNFGVHYETDRLLVRKRVIDVTVSDSKITTIKCGFETQEDHIQWLLSE